MILTLGRIYAGRWGTPSVHFVDDSIFTQPSFYSLDCMKEGCNDFCCARGEDISIGELGRMAKYKGEIEAAAGIVLDECLTGSYTNDEDVEGGSYTRIKSVNGMCVFKNKSKRGCLLHTIALDLGVDFRLIKPMAGSLFPVTFNYGLLLPSSEVLWNLEDTVKGGRTLYDDAKDSLRFYFGGGLVSELDSLRLR